MRKNIKCIFLTIFGLILAIFLTFTSSFAADIFDLSYTLIEGGFRLELNEANPYKGLRLQINSNVSCRYEVIQRLVTPLANRDNPSIVIKDNFVMRGIRGSNRLGDLRVPTNDSPVRLDQVIYVSDTIGSQDNFDLVFGINRIEELTAGNYFGRIGFILRPIGSSRSQVTKTLDVYVNISKELKTKIEILPATGLKNIILNPKKQDMQTADVVVKIEGKFNRPFSIIQLLTGALESEQGNRLDYGMLNFVVKEAKRGTAINRVTPLSAGLQTIYTSGPGGEADDYFVISYMLDDSSIQKAGRYRSRIQYLLDDMGLQRKLEVLEIEIENERQFDFVVTPMDQKYAIEFPNLKPTEPPRKSEVTIEIITNIGKRYQLSQEVYSELTNKEGKVIPSEYLTLRTESLDTKGRLKFSNQEVVKKGSNVLFISDDFGSPDKFKLIYELECPKDLQAGDYSTRITYTLLEI